MSAIRYEPRDDQWEGDDADDTVVIPGRPPRRRLGRGGILLIALLVGAIGFYVGVRVEKGQIGGSSTASAATSAPSGAQGGFAGFPGGASRNRIPGAGGGGGGASIGTVASLDGQTVYVKTLSGNTVKIKLVSATKISKSLTVSRTALRPGDSVVVQGASGSNGTLTATSVSDTGASSSSSSSSTGTGSTSSTSGGSGSGSSSLFGNTSGG